ncbi:MAG: HAMP domain-containing protein [Acidobacteria bacterium]|nr:HAMP domain-containing protein [Acidobacteriota bacterium]
MKALNIFYSFRMRLLLVLALLLIVTLFVQYYLNLRAERNNSRIRERQEQALIAGVTLGVNSISSTDRLIELRRRTSNPLLGEQTGRVANIFVIDNEWRVSDSLDEEYLPDMMPDGTLKYQRLQDITTLPPIINAAQLSDAQIKFLKTTPVADESSQGEAHAFPVETDRGRWYVIVILKSDKEPTSILNRQAARPLAYTLAVLLVATFIAGVLVWRFTRPIKDLSNAARRVAAGDLYFRVPDANRRDEMGQLASRFNEMIAGLGRTRELEAQLHQSEQSAVVGRLASAIAHEIRNPLNYINLTLDHVRTALAPEDPEKRATFNRLADQLKAEVARINTRISEFLNYTRPAKLELRPVDLRAAAEDALRLVEVQAAENNIKVSIEVAGDVPQVLADAESLRSVFTNLLINGLQAIDGEGGEISVKLSAEKMGHAAHIEIMDTGHGIAPDNISQVFEPYFSTKETGTGLGLAIVKKAIDEHGGTISVKSKQGSGTTFIITLPTQRKDEG